MSAPAFNTKRWIEIALVNFCVVALAGVTMRYKINFALPAINQKYLMHGHSNFAFVGWVAMALMILMVRYLVRNDLQTNYKKYHYILIAEVIASYAMLLSFITRDNFFCSLCFPILTIILFYFFFFF